MLLSVIIESFWSSIVTLFLFFSLFLCFSFSFSLSSSKVKEYWQKDKSGKGKSWPNESDAEDLFSRVVFLFVICVDFVDARRRAYI